MRMSGHSQIVTLARNWRPSWLFVLLVLATTVKFAAFMSALSFGSGPGTVGLLVSILQAGLWWWMARGAGVAGVVAAWLLQTLYLVICWSYFVYFGLYLTFATTASVILEGATAVRHAGLPVDIGMLWLLVDLPFVLAWCVVDRRRWRRSAVAAIAQLALLACLTAQAHRSLQWATAERDNRYTAPAVFIAELGLLPIQIAKAGAQNRSADFRYGPEVPINAATADCRDILLVQVESLDVGGIERAMPLLAARIPSAVYYPRCLAYHGAGGSSDCDVTVVEGCEPLWDAVSFDQSEYLWPNSWVCRLREAGWSAALAHGLPGTYFNFAQVMPRLGYELWDLDGLGLIEHPREFGARDSELVDAVLARLPSLPSPFLLHVVTMTSHAPFTQHRAWWSGPRSGNNYYDALACVDAQLDRLLDGFFQRAPSGLAVLFGDHAAGLPSSTIERVNGVQREYVPLLILGADVPPRIDQRCASFLDIGRTVLPAAGWSGRWRTWGSDLLSATDALAPVPYRGQPWARDAAAFAGQKTQP
jgi:phosphoglycerol transferase MdoB-like AlkP superfamily enzyme